MNLTYGFYSRSAITKIRNKIENSKYCFWAWNELQNLVVNLMLSCNFALANELLTAIFEVVSPEDFFPEDRRMLECFWHYIKHKGNVRPANVPWGRWSNEDIEQLWHRGELDPTKIEFHERGWQILSYKARRAVKSINRAIDGGNKNAAHQWKTTNDPWAILVCAMYLCKPVDVSVESISYIFT